MAGHLESMFISSQDLAELTASARSAIQIRWLRANGIPFIVGGDGMPKVARQALLHKFGLAEPAAELSLEPQASLVEMTDSWDKVTESLMAELLGVTRRALEGRRSTGAIPADIWRKVDGRVMYSMKRYEAFLERHWSPFLEPVNSPSKKPAHRKKPIQGKKETIYQLV
ncbi:DUF4224 domain-containing protein [Pseudomonas asgharzadehiana]|uniref:DUF4224 domain-containing protein n=1 Tax=Pseudomonas asgharzadehiana TaxID=2842349 RepID=A0ABX8P4G5_9PSED|nr:DUF4224 domain-containing protein [Pseudomonas asgharzadehiana]QXH68622.1 DUF4224 domain-containing protein [Pseudomonas asgharzadehiana]